ncbi:hypothetical protein BC827DRAFT_1272853 [Russula dissimulans]|nr:hypothetical protein BC827DRAFT_1272853 [Russula dissimulans]
MAFSPPGTNAEVIGGPSLRSERSMDGSSRLSFGAESPEEVSSSQSPVDSSSGLLVLSSLGLLVLLASSSM